MISGLRMGESYAGEAEEKEVLHIISAEFTMLAPGCGCLFVQRIQKKDLTSNQPL